jgi:dipeptidase E
MARILAIGGGGFLMEGDESPIDDYLLELTGRDHPRICFLATPGGDRPDYIQRFHRAFSRRRCERSHLAFFELDPTPGAVRVSEHREHLLSRDVIFVSGGNTRAALAIWREWGLDKVLADARDRNILLAGMSAGAMCWFEAACTDTYWDPGYRPLRALGFLEGGCRVHYSDHRDEQRERLHAAILAGIVPSTIAIDDGAAVFFQDSKVEKVVSWHSEATAFLVSRQDGSVAEVACGDASATALHAELEGRATGS